MSSTDEKFVLPPNQARRREPSGKQIEIEIASYTFVADLLDHMAPRAPSPTTNSGLEVGCRFMALN